MEKGNLTFVNVQYFNQKFKKMILTSLCLAANVEESDVCRQPLKSSQL